MQDLIRETVLGQVIRLVSRGKLFPPPEQRDPSIVQRYMVGLSTSSSGTLETAAEVAPAVEKMDAERGADFQLVDWIENDPEVCCYL